MFINNAVELQDLLRPKLKEYLVMKLGKEAASKTFKCYVHQDNSPSMSYNPKTDDTTVHCFACGVTHDIFAAAAHFDNLPAAGPEWITHTLPQLATLFRIQVSFAEASAADKEKAKLYKLHEDIYQILQTRPLHPVAEQYAMERGWVNTNIVFNTISSDELCTELAEKGWDIQQLYVPLLIRDNQSALFGIDKVSIVIQDHRGKPIGFTTRNLKNEPKYINSADSVIYDKKKVLFGLHTAIKESKVKGLIVVEGAGDLLALHRVGITNAVALCGTAFTSDHISLLKLLGVKQLIFSLDWDKAGQQALRRILKEELRTASGMNCYVVEPPATDHKDPGDLLIGQEVPDVFLSLKRTPAFEWILSQYSNTDPVELASEIVPIIALENAAIRRDALIKVLSMKTLISEQAIREDVSAIRDNKNQEKEERIRAAVEKYSKGLVEDPSNAQALLSQHEEDLLSIEKDFSKGSIGMDYQLSRYDALQSVKFDSEKSIDRTEFRMSRFKILHNLLSNGMPWTEGVLVYVGGRQNSGKTGFCIAMSIDIVMSDPEAMVIMHFTDDTYIQVEPRIKSNIMQMMILPTDPEMPINTMVNPRRNIKSPLQWGLYERASSVFRDLIASEKLTIIDSEDGGNLSVLEKQIKYIRTKYPEKKIFVMCDNTHNYMDFLGMDQTGRMTRISNVQKNLTGKYRCAILATAEYRKNNAPDVTKMKLPVDDDLADARALMYRPNAIFHVYNDLNDRTEEFSSIFWTKAENPNKKLPRLMLLITKNKITDGKTKLAFDLDTSTVTLKEIPAELAKLEEAAYLGDDEDSKGTHSFTDDKFDFTERLDIEYDED